MCLFSSRFPLCVLQSASSFKVHSTCCLVLDCMTSHCPKQQIFFFFFWFITEHKDASIIQPLTQLNLLKRQSCLTNDLQKSFFLCFCSIRATVNERAVSAILPLNNSPKPISAYPLLTIMKLAGLTFWMHFCLHLWKNCVLLWFSPCVFSVQDRMKSCHYQW